MAKKSSHKGHPHFLLVVAAGGLITTLTLIMTLKAGAQTTVPGHSSAKYDRNNNGIPDVGKAVVGHYTSVYAYDNAGDYYWDLGDGRVQGTVSSVEALDQDTLTTCDYVVNYKGKFEDTPYLDSGSIQNHIVCRGFDDNGTYNYEIVHKTDPRYRNNPEFAIWGDWEYHTLTESKSGNLVRPENHSN